MKSIKVIKHKQEGDPKDSKSSKSGESVERSTREIVGTVKIWIAELQRRKRAQGYSFSPLPIVVTAASENT